MPLTLLSPHRDEIRQETAQGFKDWLRARTRERTDRLAAALRAWLAQPGPDAARAVDRGWHDLAGDWSGDELAPLPELARAWQDQPTRERAEELLAELGRRPNPADTVQVVWQDVGGGTSAIVRYIRSSFQERPDGIGVDLLFGGGTDIYLRFADEGLLQKIDLPAEILARVRPDLNGVPLYDPGRRWFGPVLSSFGILNNRTVLERIGAPEPMTWDDLGRPELHNWVGAGDPRMTGSIHMVYEIILQRPAGWHAGFRLLLRMGANTHQFVRDSGTLTRAVVSGEVASAGNLDGNALSAVGRHPAMMTFRLPPAATIINPDALAVLKGAPQPRLARAFVEFTLSDAGQRLFFLLPGQPGGPRQFPLCRLSIVESFYRDYPPEVRSTGSTNPFEAGDTIRYDNKLGFGRWDALNDLFGAWVVDAHPDLKAAWRAVLDSGLSGEQRRGLEEELFAPPCTEAELNAYARALAAGRPRLRVETLTRWGEAARHRYRDVRRRCGD